MNGGPHRIFHAVSSSRTAYGWCGEVRRRVQMVSKAGCRSVIEYSTQARSSEAHDEVTDH